MTLSFATPSMHEAGWDGVVFALDNNKRTASESLV